MGEIKFVNLSAWSVKSKFKLTLCVGHVGYLTIVDISDTRFPFVQQITFRISFMTIPATIAPFP